MQRMIGLTIPMPEHLDVRIRQIRYSVADPLSDLAAHLTLVGPTLVEGTQMEVISQALSERLRSQAPFCLQWRYVGSFAPRNPVVYLAPGFGRSQCMEIEGAIRSTHPALAQARFPFQPHVTLAHVPRADALARAAQIGVELVDSMRGAAGFPDGSGYPGARGHDHDGGACVRVTEVALDELTQVEGGPVGLYRTIPLARLTLGGDQA